jgi:hypothetical protein|tara:strand:+ start:2435 stop:3223 length:789 start_codon:yes stop_codon:yes gene_type:complete
MTETLRDKNKSAYKLDGFGPLYLINLDGQPERRQYMEDQFDYWEIKDYTRISAYDGRDDDLSDIIHGQYPNITSGEIGCVTSHLKAIKHFYEETDAPYAVIMEDDCDLETVRYWPWDWKTFMAKAPYDFDILQLTVINPRKLVANIHPRYIDDFSTACYVITRHHAAKMMKLHIRGDRYKLDNGVRPRPVADDLIYNAGRSFAIPLLLYKLEMGSSIHPEHVDVFHRGPRDALFGWWANESNKVDPDSLLTWETHALDAPDT